VVFSSIHISVGDSGIGPQTVAGKNAFYLFKGSTWVVREEKNICFSHSKIVSVHFVLGSQLFAISNSSTPIISS
jgi:hypothetical protein